MHTGPPAEILSNKGAQGKQVTIIGENPQV
jgi:hypothetical protein